MEVGRKGAGVAPVFPSAFFFSMGASGLLLALLWFDGLWLDGASPNRLPQG